MLSYTVMQWLFFFYFYCFLGWCFESAYVSIKNRRLTNRGFMRGPFLPIYGSGAIMMLVVSVPFRDSVVLTYLAGCVGATVLEYVTGAVMEALFKVRYWDYSNQKFNYKGYICLGSTLAWGALTILMTEWLHMPVEKMVLAIPGQVLEAVIFVLTAVIFADFALSVKAAIDLRDVLVKMEQTKKELEHIQKRLDVIIALTNQEIEERRVAWNENVNTARAELHGGATAARIELRENLNTAKSELRESVTWRVEDLKVGIEKKLEQARSRAKNEQLEYLESIHEEIQELHTKYVVNLEMRSRIGEIKGGFLQKLIRSNPGMTSVKFKDALEELKAKASEKKSDRNMSAGENKAKEDE